MLQRPLILVALTLPLPTIGCASAIEEADQPRVAWLASETRAPSPQRGLLASPGFDGQPFKGVYFFPGEVTERNRALFTAHPTHPDDLHWNSDPAVPQRVLQRVVATHANTLVMSYWGNEMQRWSPMELNADSLPRTLAAVSGAPLLVVPSLESGFEPGTTQYWRFSDDFPYRDGTATATNLAPSLIARLHEIVALFRPNTGVNMEHWARLYDREGTPRFAVQIMHVYAHAVPQVEGKTADEVMAEAFDAIADEIARTEGIDLGFLLDIIPGASTEYSLTPASGMALNDARSILAITGFISEIFSGEITASAPGATPVDNNVSNLDSLVTWKHAYIEEWVRTGVPVIYDVSSGYDGRFVWQRRGTFFWGDNYDYTFDAWRNALSSLKGLGATGITFNTWNGYTEGFAAVPTREHGDTITRWLTDLYEPDPRVCNHVEYVDGTAGVAVRGESCATWRDLGASRGVLGAPREASRPSARGEVVHFANGSIFSGEATGTYAVYGPIHARYQELGFDTSCLGLPISDMEAGSSPDSALMRFENGEIVSEAGDVQSRCD